jgi:hypothetical protein
MEIKTHVGVSLDGYIAGPDGWPAIRGIGALDSFGVVTLPILLGDGMLLTPPGSARQPLALESSRTFPDGSVEHVYRPGARP